MEVDRGELVRAIRAGARSVRALMEATRAGTGCGTCRVDLHELLREHGAEEGGP